MTRSPDARRVRLFVALELPSDIRVVLAEWAEERLRTRGPDLRLIETEYLHATLCFLGSRPAGEVEAIAAACRDACRPASGEDRPPVTLALGAPLWLPPRRPRVVAVELDDPAAALAQLQAAVSAGLQAGGFFEPEDRPFLAHVTVARVAHRARVRPVPLAPPGSTRFMAPALTLYRSQTGPGGARYEPLATVALGGGG